VSAGHWWGSKKGDGRVGARGTSGAPRNLATCASAHSPVHGDSGEGGTNRAGPRRRERKGVERGNGSATGEPGPRDRERGGERG
jgi:hypothetical protein